MENISVFDMLKVGIGPSSSHTLGPWRAIQRWLREELRQASPTRIEIQLYGSLALTGRGHSTDVAIALALLGHDPETIDPTAIPALLRELHSTAQIRVPTGTSVPFAPDRDIVYRGSQTLAGHPNAMRCCYQGAEAWHQTDYFSIGGGFVVTEDELANPAASVCDLPYPCGSSRDLLRHTQTTGFSIAELVRHNELCWRDNAAIDQQLDRLWLVMSQAMLRGCQREGELPGGLRVLRRAAAMNQALLGRINAASITDPEGWIRTIRSLMPGFAETMRWISCFALAVNEENASMGRIVTAPTNGAAGVVPAVLMFWLCSSPDPVPPEGIRNFLLVAGEMASQFKKGATISAAAGGCQAEIGVSSAMAAAALTEALGGSVAQALMAAEIAMEHHLGLTCDPVNGLVQIPCIERNAMGAVKAINAAQLALARDSADARVSLDDVIHAMADTARDMNFKYKETSLGGLATNISVNHPEC